MLFPQTVLPQDSLGSCDTLQVVFTSAAEVNAHKQENPSPAHSSPSHALPGRAPAQPWAMRRWRRQQWARPHVWWLKPEQIPCPERSVPCSWLQWDRARYLMPQYHYSAARTHFPGASMTSPPPFRVQCSSLLCSEDGGVWHKKGCGSLCCVEAAAGLGSRLVTQWLCRGGEVTRKASRSVSSLASFLGAAAPLLPPAPPRCR